MQGGRSGEIEDAQLAERLREMGVPEALIAKQCAGPADFEVWPENQVIVEVFCAVANTQWHVATHLAGLTWLGLRYEALPLVFDAFGVQAAERATVLRGVQVMEREARRLLNADRSTGNLPAPGG